jgi:hypothetical protein
MPGTRPRLETVLRKRVAVLDGSWGVLIQSGGRRTKASGSVTIRATLPAIPTR